MSPRLEGLPPLDRDSLAADPIEQFAGWYELAREQVPLAEAMTLATADPAGDPDARMVLLKGFDAAGFRLYSNYESVKGEELEARPRAALVIYWRELDRQVRVRGPVSRLPAEESDAYFAGRPRDSQLGAIVSPQSRPVADRAELEDALERVERQLEGAEIPRPPHWGGYRVEPEAIEFWQGRKGRLHDRFRYTREGDGWVIERLAP
jgi:pyridoxamine 5'-phosphate oxidase